jgi:hypothetical protein
MKAEQLAPVRFADDGGFIIGEDGKEKFIRGYGAGRHNLPVLDPRIDLTRPIWEQVQRLARKDQLKMKTLDPASRAASN